jgi:hypothetical protein
VDAGTQQVTAVAPRRLGPAGGRFPCLIALVSLALPAAAPAQAASATPHVSWPHFAEGFALSIVAHEAAHVLSALALGGSPSLALNSGRPVIESGIDGTRHPARAFTFSAAGMTVQLAANEAILDWPHGGRPAGSFARGFLVGGIATVAFYVTVGRTAKVGDMAQMEEFSSLSPWTLTAIFGGVALSDAIRLAVEPRYGSLFVVPLPDGQLAVGITRGM